MPVLTNAHNRICRKVRYHSQHVAEAAMENMRGRPGFDCNRVYHCDRCDGWHLTSKPLLGPAPPASPDDFEVISG